VPQNKKAPATVSGIGAIHTIELVDYFLSQISPQGVYIAETCISTALLSYFRALKS